MGKMITGLTQTILFVVFIIIFSVSLADEGTSDPDFDYEPPEEIGVLSQIAKW